MWPRVVTMMRQVYTTDRVLILLLCLLNYAVAKPENNFPMVTTPSGTVQGTFQRDLEGARYMQFLGVPFAQPPIGELRFGEPKPMEPWDHTWIANSTNICIQVDHYDDPQEGVTKGVEDCLYLNVFVPGDAIIEGGNMDVMVHIHGGAFMFGSSLVYAWPTRFMNRGVIFVTLQYRLGVFGFLSTEDENQPGNLGMKDQTMALKWVHTHIHSFGGNPNSVTISGLSAGGASVHFHLISPLSRGLFHRAISVSGNALDPWAIYEAPLQKAKRLGEIVGCQYQTSKELLRCLRQRPASQLVEATKMFRSWAFLPFSPFGVVVDWNSNQPFLPEHPFKLLKEGKVADVPWYASVVSSEGLYPVSQLQQREEYFGQLKNNWDKYLPLLLHYDHTIPKKLLADVSRRIKEEYLGDREVSKETFPEITQLVSDRLFVHEMQKALKLHAAAIKSPVYFYLYDYTPEEVKTLTYLRYNDSTNYGVGHADDMLMMFEHEGKGSERDLKIISMLQDMWVAILKTGKPHMESWPELGKKPNDPIRYLYIGKPEEIEVRISKDLTKNSHFWDSLPFAEGEKLLNQYLKTEL